MSEMLAKTLHVKKLMFFEHAQKSSISDALMRG